MAENLAAMLDALLPRLESRLIGLGVATVLGVIAYLVIRRARVDPNKPATIDAIKHEAQVTSGVTIAVFGLAFLLFIGIGVLAGFPWWAALFLLPVMVWAGWWLPGNRRRVISQASIFVQGLPARVSAFVADLPSRSKWEPGLVSSTPQVAGPRGPRFLDVGKAPDGREMHGVVVLTRNEPGVAVDIQVEGAGGTGDYYKFAAQDGGTLVNKQTVVELPYFVALIGGMYMVKGEAPAAQQRRTAEVQALKSAFESDPMQL